MDVPLVAVKIVASVSGPTQPAPRAITTITLTLASSAIGATSVQIEKR